MLKSRYASSNSVYMTIASVFFSLIFFFIFFESIQASPKSGGAYETPDQYPLGVATGVNSVAGGSITFNADQVKSLQGQYFAKDFKSTGYGEAVIQNYSAKNLSDSDTDTFDKMNPSMVSDTVSGGLLRMYSNAQSFHYSKTKNLSFFIEHPPTDAELLKSLGSWDTAGVARFHEVEDKTDTLANFPAMKKNSITSFDDISKNLRNVSDYYADFTSTTVAKDTHEVSGKNALYNDAINSVAINTDHTITNSNNNGGSGVIQINIDMNKKTTKQGVVVVDINGDLNQFQAAKELSVNLLNFTSGTTKMPYIILNYKNFTSFNFTNEAWMRVAGYAPLSGDATYITDDSDSHIFKGQNTTGTNTKGVNLLTKDTTVKVGSKTIKTLFNTSSHLLHNFNTENTTLSFGTNTSQNFVGSVLAPNADIAIDATQSGSGSPLTGNLMSGQDITGNMSVDDEVASDAGFNTDDFDVANTKDDPAGFLKDSDTNTSKPTILSATVSGNNAFIPGSTKTLNASINNTSATVKQDNANLGADASTIQTSEKTYTTTLNVNPNDTSYYLWYRLNDGKWQKYAKNYKDSSSLTEANQTFTSGENTIDFNSGNAITALENQYQDKKHQYDRTAYSDKKTYAMDSNTSAGGSDQIDEGYQLIGYHLYHKNKISYLVTATNDDSINKILGSSNPTISDADLTEKDTDYTPISYILNVTGNLLVTYPKNFDFGTYKLGEDKKTLSASGTLAIDNPFKVNWDLSVNTNDSSINDTLNPLFKKDRLSWYKQVQTSKDGETLTFEQKPATSNKIDFSNSNKTIFDLPSSSLGDSSNSVINKSHYYAQLTLDFATSVFDTVGTYNYDSLWAISPTADSGIVND
ncbi:hypothetical protein LABALGNA3A7_15870 [Dellaglioa algida]|nr:hypothetical protein LABALGNA3A7_15870 [Dellaglioa algida]